MQVWLCAESEILTVERMSAAFPSPPEKAYRQGERINQVSEKKHGANKVRKRLTSVQTFAQLDTALRGLLMNREVDFSALSQCYKCISIYIDNPNEDGDFLVKSDILLEMARIDLQLEIDIERQQQNGLFPKLLTR